MKLLIAIINTNETDLLLRCLNSIRSQQIQTDYRLAVVDNHSSDNVLEILARDYPDVLVVAKQTNNGYASAVNAAIRAFDFEYVLVLNPDIIVKPSALDAAMRFMDANRDVGIAGTKLLNPDGTIQYSCRTFYTLPTMLLRRTFLGKLFPKSPILTRHLMSDWDHNAVRDVDWVLGACMLARKSALQDVGLMDEQFFLYFEDVDWCYRMHKHGWRVCYLPDAEMIHAHQRKSAKGFINKNRIFHLQSLLHFYGKWGAIPRFVRKYQAFFFAFMLLLLDLFAINLSFSSAHLIRKYLLIFLAKPHIPFLYYYNFLVFVNVVTLVVCYSVGLYTIRRGELWVDELFRVGKGVLLSSLFLMAGSYLVQGYEFSRTVIVIFAAMCILAMFAGHWGVIAWGNSLRKRGVNLRKTLIVGTGKLAGIVRDELQKHREIGFEVVGFIRDAETQREESVMPILGTVEQIPELIRMQHINEVIITSDTDSRELISRCKQDGVDVRLVTDLQSLSMHETLFEELAGIPMVFFKGNPLFGLNRLLKRGLDMLISACALLLLSPLFAIIAALIKLDSPGPVFFRQERIGKGRKPFRMFKFRSMCLNAESMKDTLHNLNEASGPIFKIQNDPRLTRVGKIIRKYSIDELPQLWNVLKGDMSLVGPRPPVPREVVQYDEWARKRLEIQPGITGLWQVSGRSNLSFDEMLKLDIYYIWNWSLANDVKILLRTIPVVISGKGAY